MMTKITIGLNIKSVIRHCSRRWKYGACPLDLNRNGYASECIADGWIWFTTRARILPLEFISTRAGSNKYVGCVASTM